MTRFSDAYQDFGLAISLKKTQVMGQDIDSPPAISIGDHELDVIYDFVYLSSTISDTLSLDAELKATTTMIRLTKKAWNNSKLTEHTKIQIYRACVVSTLLYDSESRTLRARQERKLTVFTYATSDTFWTSPGKTRSLTTLSWKELDAPACSRCWNRDMCAGLATSCAWMTDGSPKTSSTENLCRENVPQADHSCNSKMCSKRDLKALNIDQNNWEATALKRSAWRQTIQNGLSKFEEKLARQHKEKSTRRKAAAQAGRLASDFICALYHRDCHSRIGLASHTRHCTRINT